MRASGQKATMVDGGELLSLTTETHHPVTPLERSLPHSPMGNRHHSFMVWCGKAWGWKPSLLFPRLEESKEGKKEV